MFERKIETSTAKWPHTEMLVDQRMVHLTGKYADPDLGKRSMWGGFILAVLLTTIAWFVFPSDKEGWVHFILVFLFVIQPILYLTAAFLFFFRRKNLDVKIGANTIDIDGNRYARDRVIQFHIAQHHKAVKMEEKTGRSSREYGSAVEVIMQYGEIGVPIAAIRGRDMEKANALVIRLQNICNQFDEAIAGMAEGQTDTIEPVGGDFGPEPDMR